MIATPGWDVVVAGEASNGVLAVTVLDAVYACAVVVGEANISTSMITAKTGHKSLRSLARYVKPGLAAVHEATDALSSPRRRG
ncbi:MAG: hypothetical protein ACRDNS_25470 [Trebonia sp.]